jgi:hypothetical protein
MTKKNEVFGESDLSSRRRRMIQHLVAASRLAAQEGMSNLLGEPGMVRQLIVSDALGLVPCITWRDGQGDAYLAEDPGKRFEIFSALEGRRFQAGAVGKDGRASREDFRRRILGSKSIYFAVFDSKDSLKLHRIYEIDPSTLLKKADEMILGSASETAHISISERWIAERGKIVHPKSC